MNTDLLTTEVRTEEDLVLVRQRARQIAELLGLPPLDQTRVATAVSEITRNAVKYASGGRATFGIERSNPASFVVRVVDAGPGIANLDAVLRGRFKSKSGMGLGIFGAKQLMDRFHLTSAPGKGTTVELALALPNTAPEPTPALLAKIAEELARRADLGPMAEVRHQNQELLQALTHARECSEKLQRTVRFNDILVGVLGHDLRNPLSAITVGASLLLMRAESEQVSKPSARILASAERMARMIDQILDLTRIRLGTGLSIDSARMDLGELIGAIVAEFDAEGSTGQIQAESSGDLAGTWDRDRLGQVLSNLLGNARRHGVPGGTIGVDTDGQALDFVVVRVSNGGTIAPDLLSVIFEPLQMGPSRHGRSSGLGLGLFITKQIAEAHGGSIGVESNAASGTTFSLRLPRMPPTPAAARADVWGLA